MKKLMTVLAGLLLTMPLAALDASEPLSAESSAGLRHVPSVTAYCWVRVGNQWMLVPC